MSSLSLRRGCSNREQRPSFIASIKAKSLVGEVLELRDDPYFPPARLKSYCVSTSRTACQPSLPQGTAPDPAFSERAK
jgi:hypothetical protein